MAAFEYRQAQEIQRVFADMAFDEGFEEAWSRRIDVEGFPVCHLDDIIASKRAANRQKDRESLGRLEAFREYWRTKKPFGGS